MNRASESVGLKSSLALGIISATARTATRGGIGRGGGVAGAATPVVARASRPPVGR